MQNLFSKDEIEKYAQRAYQYLEECLVDMCEDTDENKTVTLNMDFDENAVYCGNCFDGFFDQICCCRLGNTLFVEVQKLGDSQGFYKDWSTRKYMQTMYEICQDIDGVWVSNFYYEDDDPLFRSFFIAFLFDIEQYKYYEQIYKYCRIFCTQLENLAQRKLAGCYWSKVFEKDEMEFCRMYLTPFFKKMGFEQVIFNHGNNEYGKDYILVSKNIFGEPEYYGVQAKAGSLGGSATSNISEIKHQINMGFEIPYKLVNGKEIYISKMIIAISGNFTENAQTIIQNSLEKYKRANTIFLSKKELENHQIMTGL